jgi:long-chain acyl-CoA synthetase
MPTDPTDVFTVSFSAAPGGEILGTQFTHENITAGVVATRGLFPLSNGTLGSTDTVVSSQSLGTPIGRTIAYTALYEGCSFATTKSSAVFSSESRFMI